MKRGRTIFMLRQQPAGLFIREEIHVKNSPAAARADHRGLFREPVFLHNIERAPPEPVREQFFNNNGSVRRNQPVVELVPRAPK